ncbi:MAG: fibronectin type III domain-containing protein [Deltaproteobacteria bacterium]|nr:fibronectin type III domain-containing protein [Deltaproteobacteria bacterium]
MKSFLRPLLFAALLWGLCAPWAMAEERLAPPQNLTAADHPWDHGDKVDLSWDLSTDDPSLVRGYRIYSATSPDGPFAAAGIVQAGTSTFTVEKLDRNTQYFFRAVAFNTDIDISAPAQTRQAMAPTRQWFDGDRAWLATIILIFCGAVFYWINHAKKGKPLYVRKIAGLEAVDEALGRATEMGRPCLYLTGLDDMNDMQTIASLTVLGRVARHAAEYDTKLEVPNCRSLVMTAAKEVVHQSFLEAGRPDAYNDDLIYYITDDQFGFAAAIQGIQMREKPAACFYLGGFYAEALILAETGNSINAIQIAGTARTSNLPFFVAACDYTLIGEELFAASAYLSGDAVQLGSIKGQDVGKIILFIFIVVGVTMFSLSNVVGVDTSLGAWLYEAVTYIKSVILV